MGFDNSQPRMLRQDNKSLGNIPCVAAFNTMEAIIKKDATHPAPAEKHPTYKDIINSMSDNILDKHTKGIQHELHIFLSLL